MRILAADVRPAKIDGAPTQAASAAPTRRAMIGGAGLAVLGVAVAATGPAAASEIERHWQERAQTYREFDADPVVLYDHESAKPYWARIDAAEEAILASTDSSTRATEIRLWTAWSHTDRELGTAITQGDTATLRAHFDDLDWHEKLLFSAILALRGEAMS